jgi:SpoIID/LytB domain protein
LWRLRTALTVGVAAISLMLTLLPPVNAAESGSNIIFAGSGWGHGVGMSQYGAYGMAFQGSTSDQIINHYYSGSSAAPVATVPIWVNLERDFPTLQLTVANVGAAAGAPVVIKKKSEASGVTALPGAVITLSPAAPGCSVAVTNPGQAEFTVTDQACEFDFKWYEWATPGQTPTTKVAITGCFLSDWNVSPTASRPCEYARGTLHLRSGPGGLDLSAEMLIDDYVAGVSEVPTSWPAAALQAQAIASRSYAVARQLERGDPASNSCDGWCHVKDTTADQRYVGWGHANVANWLAAVQATAGKVVTHPTAPNGVVTAYYSSSSGGLTENVEEKFGGPPRQYLTSVDDSVAVDGTVVNPKASWTASFSPTVVANALGFDILLGVKVTETRTSGSAALMEYSGLVNGQYTVIEKTGTWTRTTFGLYSEYFSVSYTPPVLESDELFFYRSTDGVFKYYNTKPNGALGSVLNSGVYSKGWDSITAVDLDGDGKDEQFFYRSSDGVFKYYDVKPNGALATLLQSGVYSKGWDSITAVDLDGDGKDEFFFYRSSDGVFKYYKTKSNGALATLLQSGVYSKGWDSITAVDLEGDGKDEQFFYRSSDGVFKYYDVKASGALSALLQSGVYSTGWGSITALQLD